MIPFLSSIDVVVAAGAVTGLSALSTGVYLLARWQRPAEARTEAVSQAPATAEANVAAAA